MKPSGDRLAFDEEFDFELGRQASSSILITSFGLADGETPSFDDEP